MKKISVVLLVVLSMTCAGLAEAAKKKRTRNANRVGPYGVGLVGMSTFSGDATENEQALEDVLEGFDFPIRNLSSETEDTDIGYQITFGYRFNRYFAAEFGLVHLGSLETTARAELDPGEGFIPTSVSLTYSAGGPLFSAVGILPLSEKFELFARAGYLFTSSERELGLTIDGDDNAFGSAKGDSQDPVFGVGFAWNINQVYSIRAEYQVLDSLGQSDRTGEEDLTVIGIGLSVRF